MNFAFATLIACLACAGAPRRLPAAQPVAARGERPVATASSSQADAGPQAAFDGERFSVAAGHVWKGDPDARSWWWQCSWNEPRDVGAILQIAGDDPIRLRNAPRRSVWQSSLNGNDWTDIDESAIANERRSIRLHRLKTTRRARFLRLKIDAAHGEFPTLRHIELWAQPGAPVELPPWILVVSTLDRAEWEQGNAAGSEFVPLARRCPGWEDVPAQQVWLGDFDPEFIAVEPRPLCAFLSGNFSDWCRKNREDWRGTQQVLEAGALPMWAACGGAQGLAILADTGADTPWDCPHCRDPENPRLPIYGHIGHTGPGRLKCSEYGTCLFERGPYAVRILVDDPVFEGLPREFEIMESHCGQIEYAPRGWVHLATHGPGGQTKMQCLRVKDRPIYAAQFHIEMDGTPENSRRIMANFLGVAKAWDADGGKGAASRTGVDRES